MAGIYLRAERNSKFPVDDLDRHGRSNRVDVRHLAAVIAGGVLIVVAVAGLHGVYRAGDGLSELLTWAGLLLLAITALGGGVKLVMWGLRPVTSAVFDLAKDRLSRPAQAVIATGAVVGGAFAMWWLFRGGYSSWWQSMTGEREWSLLLGVGQMTLAVLAGAALFSGGKFLVGLVKGATGGDGAGAHRNSADPGLEHPRLVAALIAGGVGLVILTAWLTPRLYEWVMSPKVMPAAGAIGLLLIVAIFSNLGWWKGLAGLWAWATNPPKDGSSGSTPAQRAGAATGVVAVILFCASGFGLGLFTPATVPLARAACPPDCGGPGGGDQFGGGQMFQPPSQGGQQMPDYSGFNSGYPGLDQNGGVSIYNQGQGQGWNASTPNNTGYPQQQGLQPGQNPDGSWNTARNGEVNPPDYQTSTPYTEGPGAPNPDYQGGQANPGNQPNQGVQQPSEQPGQNQPPQNNSEQQRIDDLTRQLQEQQRQAEQERQRLQDLNRQLQQKQNQKQQQTPKWPNDRDRERDKEREEEDREKQSGDNDLVSLLLGAVSTRRRKQDDQQNDDQQQGPSVQGLPGDVQTYVESGQQIGQSSGQAAQGFGQAGQAGASLASSAQSGAVNPQDVQSLIQGASQGVQGTADAINAGSQIVKTGQKNANQAAQAVGQMNPALRQQVEQFTQANDQASQVTDQVSNISQMTSQAAGAVNQVSSMGGGSFSGTATAMSGPTSTGPAASPMDIGDGPGSPTPAPSPGVEQSSLLDQINRMNDRAIIDTGSKVIEQQELIDLIEAQGKHDMASEFVKDEANSELERATTAFQMIPDYSQASNLVITKSGPDNVAFTYSDKNGDSHDVTATRGKESSVINLFDSNTSIPSASRPMLSVLYNGGQLANSENVGPGGSNFVSTEEFALEVGLMLIPYGTLLKGVGKAGRWGAKGIRAVLAGAKTEKIANSRIVQAVKEIVEAARNRIGRENPGVAGSNPSTVGQAPDLSTISGAVSPQKQGRHIKGDPLYNGGGYFNSITDAQAVLDAVRSGQAQFLGMNRSGMPVYRFGGVTGFNVNQGAGYVNQATNDFIIKGSSSVSVVPTTPGWTP